MKRKVAIFGGLMGLILLNYQTTLAQGPAGYTYCAREGGSYTLSVKSHVAYGTNGHFNYRYNQTGTITFDNGTFGDPAPGVVKSGYYKVATGGESTTDLSAALRKIKDHLAGASSLTATQVNEQTGIIQTNIYLMGENETVMTEALDVVSYYETNESPLFINAATEGGFPNAWGQQMALNWCGPFLPFNKQSTTMFSHPKILKSILHCLMGRNLEQPLFSQAFVLCRQIQALSIR